MSIVGEDSVCRILSIQSHVVHGYVGNRSAVYPLQILGFDVDFINSVQFSNHTWYGHFPGQVLDSADLTTLYEGLKTNDINKYDYVLTGYIGSESFLNKVCDIIKDLKAVNKNLKYVCDPVMGDDGTWYVPKELLPIYREKILPLADIILPNDWEAEQLVGRPVTSELEAISIMDELHSKGPQTVVISSSKLGSPDKLVGFASTIKGGQKSRIRMEIGKLDTMFIGTGDLLAALWLAWSHALPTDIKGVALRVQSTMHHVLTKTLRMAQEAAGAGNKPNWDQVELKLVQCKKHIENPELCVEVTDI